MKTEAAFSFGMSIRNNNLEKISAEDLVSKIRDTSLPLATITRQLRAIKKSEGFAYDEKKKMLPFFICASFSPSYRKTANMEYVQHFIIDLDHIPQNGLDIKEVKKKITSDPRTMICYLSPGADGLKVVMQLSERCHDAGVYKLFYKKFISIFRTETGLEDVIDECTCDITRACFICTDEDAYFNPEPQNVVIDDYLRSKDTSPMPEIRKRLAESSNNAGEKEPGEELDPDEKTYEAIRQMLRQKKKAEKAPVFVPECIRVISDSLQEYVQNRGITVTEFRDIEYGRRLTGSMGSKKCEVSIFYGKRGFSIVPSTRSGMDPGLNKLLHDIISSFLIDNSYV